MTSQPAYPGYATPTFTRRKLTGDWLVRVAPGALAVGRVFQSGPAGWLAQTPAGMYVGLFPTQQVAGEALVRHAGYEVLG